MFVYPLDRVRLPLVGCEIWQSLRSTVVGDRLRHHRDAHRLGYHAWRSPFSRTTAVRDLARELAATGLARADLGPPPTAAPPSSSFTRPPPNRPLPVRNPRRPLIRPARPRPRRNRRWIGGLPVSLLTVARNPASLTRAGHVVESAAVCRSDGAGHVLLRLLDRGGLEVRHDTVVGAAVSGRKSWSGIPATANRFLAMNPLEFTRGHWRRWIAAYATRRLRADDPRIPDADIAAAARSDDRSSAAVPAIPAIRGRRPSVGGPIPACTPLPGTAWVTGSGSASAMQRTPRGVTL